MGSTLKAFCLIFKILPLWNAVYFLWQEWKKHLPLLLTPTGFQWSSELDPANPCIFLGVGIQTLNTGKQNNKNRNTLLKEMKIKNMLSCYTHQNEWKNIIFILWAKHVFSCCLGPRSFLLIHQSLDKTRITLAVCWAQRSKTRVAQWWKVVGNMGTGEGEWVNRSHLAMVWRDHN